MKISKIRYLILILLCWGCSTDENGDVPPVELIRSIIAAPQSDNALRMDIKIDFKKAVAFQIEYWKAGNEASLQTTPPANAVTTAQSTLMLLTSQTDYNFRVVAQAGNQATRSDIYKFTTGMLPARIPEVALMEDKMTKPLPGYLLITRNEKPANIIMTNTEGEVVWYHMLETVMRVATFDARTNTIACIVDANPHHPYAGSRVMVIDLNGIVLFEKQIADLIPHHEVKRLPNGDLLMVRFVPKKFDLTAHGGSAEETVYGDGLVVMDMQGNVKWEWDCFDEVSPVDDPAIMQTIAMLNLRYCDDWLHANSADMDEEGNFYITFNWTSELWKIDGKTKKVIYRLGGKGNIEIPQEAYMQGIHCVSAISKNQALVFDNGMITHRSRGLLFTVNETTRKAELTNCIELPGEYSSMFQGSVRRINDNLYLLCPTLSNAIIFTDAKGAFLRTLKTMNQSYRAQYIEPITWH